MSSVFYDGRVFQPQGGCLNFQNAVYSVWHMAYKAPHQYDLETSIWSLWTRKLNKDVYTYTS